MEGVTGLNEQKVKDNITVFYEKMDNICWTMERALTCYYSELFHTWCSPKAVEFNKYLDEMWAANRMIYDTCYNIVENAVRAYNVVARTNGLDSWYPNFPDKPVNKEPNVPYVLVDSRDGVVGMNVMQVRLSTEEFKQKVENSKKGLESLPTELALYDPDNLQQNTYSNELNKAKQNFVEVIRKTLSEITEAIETESQTILLAKQQSVESLQNLQA